jgi:hypothetical protein
MLNIPPEEKAQVEIYLTETARILRKYTEPEKLNSFESIELELRTHRSLIFSSKRVSNRLKSLPNKGFSDPD